jgi:hypothetical protein
MRRSREIGIHANAARAWSKAAGACDGKAVLISPYITSSVAQTLARQSRASIYTLFDAELFARGSSSLSSLERLLREGAELYFVPNLHAKVMLFGDAAASVGSQNLTRRGTQSKEATAVFANPRAVARLQALVKHWIQDAEPITLAMVAAMKKALPALKRSFATPIRDAQSTTTQIVEEAKAAKARERETNVVVTRIRAALVRYPRPASSILSSVKELGSGRNSLVPESSLDTFTWWRIGSEVVGMARTQRYLCLNEQTGMIGWGRVMKRRISFIEDDFVDELTFDGRGWNVLVRAEWDAEKISTSNLSISVRTQRKLEVCRLQCSFEVDRLRILKVTNAANETYSATVQSFRKRRKQLEKALLPILLKPFRYARALAGSRADKFVGPPGTKVRVEAVQLADYEILLFRNA